MSDSRIAVPFRGVALLGFVIWAVLSAVAAALLLNMLGIQYSAHLHSIESSRKMELELAKVAVASELKSVRSDLLYLADHLLLREYLRLGEGKQALGETFLSFCREKGIYDQIRFIDGEGMETVRVNYLDGAPSMVSRRRLQDKSQRYYFKDTISLDTGEIFVSPLDLNIEHGKIEEPPKPVIRFGTPVHDSAGVVRGIVVLNYLADNLLEQLSEGLMLLNNEGYWLSGGDRETQWAFMYGVKNTFAGKYPQLWEKMLAGDDGRGRTEEFSLAFITLRPLTDGMLSSTGSGKAFSPSDRTVRRGEYFWKLVAMAPRLSFFQWFLRNHAVYPLVGASSLLLVFSLLVSRTVILRRMTYREMELREKELLAANRELEQALSEVKQLSGLLPICATCKKIRDDKGYWKRIESYIQERSEAQFTHGICPGCAEELYSEIERGP